MYVGIVRRVFGNTVMRSKPACRPHRTAVRGCVLIDTRKPGRLTCGLRTTCRSVGQERLAKAGQFAARPGSPGVDRAGRGWGPTVVPRANVATLFAWVPYSGWPLPLSQPIGWQNGGKMAQKGGKMATFAGTCYVTIYDATPVLPSCCVNCRRKER